MIFAIGIFTRALLPGRYIRAEELAAAAAAAHCYAVLVRILLCFEINLLLLIVLCACLARRKGVITHVINATQFASALSHGPRPAMPHCVPHTTHKPQTKRERKGEEEEAAEWVGDGGRCYLVPVP